MHDVGFGRSLDEITLGGMYADTIFQEEELPPLALEPVMEHKDFLKVVVDFKKALAEVQKKERERLAAEKAKAEAKNRGARMADIQNGRATNPE